MASLKPQYVDLLAVILTPAVRFCLRRGVGFLELIEVLRAVFVKLAAREIQQRGEKLTTSRLSVMTGIQRRDVKRIREQGLNIKERSNLVTRIIGQWEQDSRFSTTGRRPRLLSYRGENNDFERLVRSVSQDVGPVAVLADLERRGLVERTEQRLRLKDTVNLSPGELDEGFALLARDTETFASAVEENLFSGQDPRNLYICTHYDNIFQSDIPKIRNWLYHQGQLFHKKARDYLARHDQDINPRPEHVGGAKVTLVAFSRTTIE